MTPPEQAGKWQSAVMLLELAQKLAMPVDRFGRGGGRLLGWGPLFQAKFGWIHAKRLFSTATYIWWGFMLRTDLLSDFCSQLFVCSKCLVPPKPGPKGRGNAKEISGKLVKPVKLARCRAGRLHIRFRSGNEVAFSW